MALTKWRGLTTGGLVTGLGGVLGTVIELAGAAVALVAGVVAVSRGYQARR